MTTKQEFFVTLPSNVKSSAQKEDNVITNFRTRLKQRLVFPPNEDWRVGIAEIMYTKSWFNVKKSIDITFITEFGKELTLERNPIELKFMPQDVSKPELFLQTNPNPWNVSQGNYDSIQKFIDILNFIMVDDENSSVFMPKLVYDKIRNRVFIFCGKIIELYSDVDRQEESIEKVTKFIPRFGNEIEQILGLVDYDGVSFSEKLMLQLNQRKLKEPLTTEYTDNISACFERNLFMGPRVTDIKAGFNSIFVYSNVVQHSFVGDAYAQLLRAIPIKESANWGDVVQTVFNEPHFIPLQSRNFDTIEIDVRDDTGSKIQFKNGRLIVKLIFRRYD